MASWLATGVAAVVMMACIAGGAHAQSTAKRKVKSTPERGILYATRADAMAFADDVASRREMDVEWVRRAIGQARLLARVPQLMLPAPKGVPKNWGTYRKRFIDDVRIQAGVQFWNQNQASLERAEREMGVPAAMIVGIIGVETIYGQNMGSFRVIDALTTLTFDFPDAHPRASERTAFFKRELEQFLSLTYRSHTDPMSLRGSYAGAMGLGQFMPSSWSRYAIDFDGDGKVDLFSSPADAIGSVANYFLAYGWKPAMPTHYLIDVSQCTPEQLDALLLPDILPTFSASAMQSQCAILDEVAAKHHGSLALIELQNGGDVPTFVAGTENFYTVTRYNWSSYYAMAVIELGQEVARARSALTRR